jgi:hypothetical protein
MVHIELPIHIQAGALATSLERLGITLQYTESPLQLNATIENAIATFQECIQYKEGVPQDTVTVSILNKTQLLQSLIHIFETTTFSTDISTKLLLADHLSAGLATELSKSLGLNAIRSDVQIPTTDLFVGIANSLLSNMESSDMLRQYVYEQYLQQSPDRFYPGKNDVYAPIPFAAGDKLSFFLTLRFDAAIINGVLPLVDVFTNDDIPLLKYIVTFSFAS